MESKTAFLCDILPFVPSKSNGREIMNSEEDIQFTLLHSSLNAAPIGIMIAYAPDVRISFINKAAFAIMGYHDNTSLDNSREILPHEWEIFHVDGSKHEESELPLSRSIKKGETINNSLAIIHRPDGEPRFLRYSSAPVINSEHEIYAGIVHFVDVTDEILIQKRLEESEAKYRRLIEEAHDGVIIISKTLIKFANNEFANLIGRPKKELINTSIFEYVVPGDHATVTKHYKERIKNGEPVRQMKIKGVEDNGHHVDVEISASMITFEDKPATLAFIRNITDHRKSEKERKSMSGNTHPYSIPGQGTKFAVYLPVATSEPETGAGSSEKILPGNERIMIVDDDDANVLSISGLLEDIGYATFGFTDSQKALASFKEAPDQYDLICTDYTMPNLSGISLAKSISKIRNNIPILLISGLSDVISEQETKEAGIRAKLSKPIDLDDLSNAIKGALGS